MTKLKPRMKIKSGQDLRTNVKSSEVFILNQIASQSKTFSPVGALQIAAFYACVQDKAETIGQLPVRLYRRTGVNREEIKTGRTHRIFSQKPCDYLTMAGFLEMMVVSLETVGAFYAYKERNDRGNISAIIPFRHQDNVHPSMDTFGNVYYTYVTNDGKIRDPYAIDDLIIIKKFTLDGYTPVRPVWYMANLLGIADAQDKSYKELQEQGITSQMALQTDGIFTDDKAIERLKRDWGEYRGPQGRTKIPILEQGMKPVSLKLTPQETELMKQKEFSVDQISSMTGVPLHRINSGSNVTVGVTSELDESYMSNRLNPILKKFEAAWNEFLPDDTYVEFDRKAFYAGSPWRLVEHVEREVKGGLATINEGRTDLGREIVDGGDVFAIDNNNVTYGIWTDLPKLQEKLYGQANNTDNTEESEDEN